MRRNTLAGLLLTLLGLTILLICSIPITSTEEVINTSFTVSPGIKYGPYDEGTVYHTRIGFLKMPLLKSVLKGEVVVVEGEGIYLTVGGYNTKHLKNIYVEGYYNFVIDPAHDQYTFIFDNTGGDAESFIRFTLKEVWTGPMLWTGPKSSILIPLLVMGMIGFLLFLSGLTILTVTYFRSRRRHRRFL